MKRISAIARTIAALALSAAPAAAQYNSGSTGVNGVFPPAPVPSGARYMLWDLKTGLIRYCSAYDTTLRLNTCTTEVSTAQIGGIPAGGPTNGIYQFSNVDLLNSPNFGVLDVYLTGYDSPVPLTILSQNSVHFRAVNLHVEGHNGSTTQSGVPPTGFGAPGGMPGPGGFAGGSGGKLGAPSTSGGAGFGPGGGLGGVANVSGQAAGSDATVTPVGTSLIPLAGGSGGGGGGAFDTVCGFRGGGAGGGGGGGAVLIAANVQIFFEAGGSINVRGGNGGDGCSTGDGGDGSGGAIRLVAPLISGNAQLLVGSGIVRIEGNSGALSGFIDTLRGTVLAAPQTAVPTTGFPTLRLTSVGGVAVGPNPTGMISTPDVTFATAPSGPVTVNIAASNIPTGTVVKVRASPLVGAATLADSTALVGSPQASTATASLAIPAGAGVITAATSFPVTTAMLDRLPLIPGMKPALIEVTADASGASRLFLIGEDSRRVELTLGADGRYAVVN